MKRIPRIFQNLLMEPSHEITITQAATHHLLHVLRIQTDQPCILFNGDGYEYEGVIVEIKKKGARVKIQKKYQKNSESFLQIHLGQALSKSDHMDFTLQKSVELGVHTITPLLSDRSEKYTHNLIKKLAHWQNVIISATEQSGRTHVPILHNPILFSDWVKQNETKTAFILDPFATNSFLAQNVRSDVSLTIGPEGGFSNEEIVMATTHTLTPISLGTRILRTETAGIAAITAVQLLYGDMGKSNEEPQ